MDDEVSEPSKLVDIIRFYRRPAFDMYKCEMLSRAPQWLLKMPTGMLCHLNPTVHPAQGPKLRRPTRDAIDKACARGKGA